MYVSRNTEVRSCNHWCSGKKVSIAYCECVFVDLGSQHAVNARHCHLRTACWIPKATNTYSEYVILIALTLQQWLHKRASILRYSTFPVLLLIN